jgi:chemotaxis protein methyltransferase CheR
MTSARDLGVFDIVFCRNVLIYFDVATKKRVLGSLSTALADDGYLALGAAERVGGIHDGLHFDPRRSFIFVKDRDHAASGAKALATR